MTWIQPLPELMLKEKWTHSYHPLSSKDIISHSFPTNRFVCCVSFQAPARIWHPGLSLCYRVGATAIANSIAIFIWWEFACKSLLTYLFLNKFFFVLESIHAAFLDVYSNWLNHAINSVCVCLHFWWCSSLVKEAVLDLRYTALQTSALGLGQASGECIRDWG